MRIGDLVQFCESPIERKLIEAMTPVFGDFENICVRVIPLAPMEYSILTQLPDGGAYLIPQAVIEDSDIDDEWSYRIDLLMVCGREAIHRHAFAIECDGHEWHEKTKEQVARDKLRDRRLVMVGITPIRFSGSEIHRDAASCVEYLRGLCNARTGDALGATHNWNELKKFSRKENPSGPGFKKK